MILHLIGLFSIRCGINPIRLRSPLATAALTAKKTPRLTPATSDGFMPGNIDPAGITFNHFLAFRGALPFVYRFFCPSPKQAQQNISQT